MILKNLLNKSRVEDWFENWPTLLAALGLGGSGSIVGHKLVDKEQNKRLSKLETKVHEIDSSIKLNDGVDKQFRSSVENRLGSIEGSLSTLTKHLLAKKR
tara:strand:- start:516 stop:815 length:300 start_codon:yes stop_codon:yes gene_type:complete